MEVSELIYIWVIYMYIYMGHYCNGGFVVKIYSVWTKKNYMMITLPYLGPVHTTYDFNKTLNAHNSKWPILPL